MGKFLFTEVRTPTGEDTSAFIRFAALRLDGILQTTMDQRFRVMSAAKIVAEAQGNKIESIRFEDRRPLLVSWDQGNRSTAHKRFCELISEGIDDNIALGTPHIVEVSSDFIYRLNNEWPVSSTVDIDMDGYAFTWAFMFKYSVWEAYITDPSEFMSMDQLLGDSYESV